MLIASLRSTDLAVATIFITAWSLFLLHVTNAERLSSSVLRQVQYQLRNSEDVKGLVGEGVRYAENWWGESCFGEATSFGISEGRSDEWFETGDGLLSAMRSDKRGVTSYDAGQCLHNEGIRGHQFENARRRARR